MKFKLISLLLLTIIFAGCSSGSENLVEKQYYNLENGTYLPIVDDFPKSIGGYLIDNSSFKVEDKESSSLISVSYLDNLTNEKVFDIGFIINADFFSSENEILPMSRKFDIGLDSFGYRVISVNMAFYETSNSKFNLILINQDRENSKLKSDEDFRDFIKNLENEFPVSNSLNFTFDLAYDGNLSFNSLNVENLDYTNLENEFKNRDFSNGKTLPWNIENKFFLVNYEGIESFNSMVLTYMDSTNENIYRVILSHEGETRDIDYASLGISMPKLNFIDNNFGRFEFDEKSNSYSYSSLSKNFNSISFGTSNLKGELKTIDFENNLLVKNLLETFKLDSVTMDFKK